MKIRKAIPSDAKKIHDLHMRSIQEICAPFYSKEAIAVWGGREYDEAHRLRIIEEQEVLVLEEKNQIYGFLNARIFKKNNLQHAYLHALYLAPEVLHQGWGKKMFQTFLEDFKSKDGSHIFLYSTINAEKFYRLLGFRVLPGPKFVAFSGVHIPSFPMEMWIKNAPPLLDLVWPDVKYKDSFLEGFHACTNEKEKTSWAYGDPKLLKPEEDFSLYVKNVIESCLNPPPGLVRCSLFWAIEDGKIVGRIALRHVLDKPMLLKVAGHVGYIASPMKRGQGITTEMLRLFLMTEEARKTSPLLITCDPDNLGSIRVIEKNGGKKVGEFQGVLDNTTYHKLHFEIQ